jgi:hypothetical protein
MPILSVVMVTALAALATAIRGTTTSVRITRTVAFSAVGFRARDSADQHR